MTQKQNLPKIMVIVLVFLGGLLLFSPGRAFSQMTIPTRTPTPGGESPTDEPSKPTAEPTKGGGGQNPPPTDIPPEDTPVPPTSPPPVGSTPTQQTPVATNTAQPSATAVTITAPVASTATQAANVANPGIVGDGSEPITSYLFPPNLETFPTAEPCGEPPTYTAKKDTGIFWGPGNDYTKDSILKEEDIRPIVGRARNATWWLIQLDNRGDFGWVVDKDGIVNGLTANVPQLEPPDINGKKPTPGPLWEPTPSVLCTVTPTTTATAIGPAGSTDNEQVSAGKNVIDYEVVEQTADESAADSIRSSLASTAQPIDVPSPSSTPNFLPIAGLVLIIAAVFVALFLRRGPRSSGGETP